MAHVPPAHGFSPSPPPFSLLVRSNLCLLLIPPMRLRSRSNSITVDLMATEKIEDTDNVTSYAISCNCVSCTDSFKLESHWENAFFVCLECREKEKMKWLYSTHHGNTARELLTVVLLYTLCSCIAQICLVLLTINVFFYPSLWRKLSPDCLKNCLDLLLVGNMNEKIWRFPSLSVLSSRLDCFPMYNQVFFMLPYLSVVTHFLNGKRNSVSYLQVKCSPYCQIPAWISCRTKTVWNI